MQSFTFLNLNIIIIITILLICINIPFCDSFRFNLQSGSTKCIAEEIKYNSMTVGKYTVVNTVEQHPLPASLRITARVTSPRGYNYHHGDVIDTGTFAFTAPDTGDYMTCFGATYHNPPLKIPIDFDWKTGVDAKDLYNVARKGQMDLLDIELKRMYNTVISIHDEMFYLREREEEMQQLNKSTKSNMVVLSFFSVIIVSSVAVMQLWHLKEYFQRKKLL